MSSVLTLFILMFTTLIFLVYYTYIRTVTMYSLEESSLDQPSTD